MHPVLRLYEDVLSSAENVEFQLPPLPRFIFVVHGSALIADETVNAGEAWQGEGAALVKPGPGGVTCWRWELSRGDQGSTVASAPGMASHEKLTAYLETLPKGELLMRGDSVAFPPGGWFESGPDAVFAQASPDKPSRFIRVMILPRALAGKSSLEYLNEEDKAKPKTQSYKIYADAPISFGAARK